MGDISRREFVIGSAGAVLAGACLNGQPPALTPRKVVELIQAKLAVTWRTETVDTFKAGNPDTAVRGIATTVMATMSVLERAAAAGRNFVITHEPTFYGHTDTTAEIETDPIYQRKAALIKKHDLVVWRFHDHWHMRRPEPMAQGFFRAMGWEQYLPVIEPDHHDPRDDARRGGQAHPGPAPGQGVARHRRAGDESHESRIHARLRSARRR